MSLLIPPLAFLGYLILATLLSQLGKYLAGARQATASKSALYTGGESLGTLRASPGYRPFFKTALFFAIVHLGALVLGTSDLSPVTGIYLIGLIAALVVLGSDRE